MFNTSNSIDISSAFYQIKIFTALEGLSDDDPKPAPKSGKRRPASHHAHKTAAGGPASITARLPRGVTAI